jgi:hypothetical protein
VDLLWLALSAVIVAAGAWCAGWAGALACLGFCVACAGLGWALDRIDRRR